MKKAILAIALVSLLALGGQSFAELCTVDAVPAATLLLPYFAVDLTAAQGQGVDTLFSINNASATPALAHVTVWTDWSFPVLDFDVFLTGFDVQTVSMYNVLVNGSLPHTADAQSDIAGNVLPPAQSGVINEPGLDDASPHQGLYANNPPWDGSFTNCLNFFTTWTDPILSADRRARHQAELTGKPSPAYGGCVGADHDSDDNIARGYITIDSVDECSIDFPSDPTYFTDLVNPAVANNNNVLWGDFWYLDPEQDYAHGDTLVHIEANDGLTSTNIPLLDPDGLTVANVANATGYTFYRRYTVFNGTEDQREALGTTWGIRYVQPNAVFTGGTDLVVWRDSTSAEIDQVDGYLCGAPGELGVGPTWHPLNETEVIAFNESEDAVELCIGGTFGPPISPPEPGTPDPVCFPLETQRVTVGDGALAPPFNFGWLYLNLNVGIDSPLLDFDPGTSGTLAQSHVASVLQGLGVFSVGLNAVELTSACEDVDPVLASQNGGLWNIPEYIIVQ